MTSEIIIRPYEPGDASLVSSFQMKLYARQYGFLPVFERYLAESVADFLNHSEGSMLWVAEADGRVAGSIAVLKKDSLHAKLRWFAVAPEMQGKGLGKKLFSMALSFCRENGLTHAELWTIEILKAARHIYAANGFACTGTQPNTDWCGKLLKEEKWEADLS